jgi:hypothetical protein
MADELNLSNRGSQPPSQKDNHRVRTGLLLGCATNLALILILPFLAYTVLGFFSRALRPANGNFLHFLPSVLGMILIANGIIIFRAYRRDQRGIVIGFSIAGSLALLLATMCWSSGNL